MHLIFRAFLALLWLTSCASPTTLNSAVESGTRASSDGSIIEAADSSLKNLQNKKNPSGGEPQASVLSGKNDEVIPLRASASESNKDFVKKSRSGICHAAGSTYYSRTKTFQKFSSLNSCLKSGGRLPKR